MFYGRGAGELPTGSAVVGDIIAILRSNIDIENVTPVVKNNLWKKEIKSMNDVNSKYYIRSTVKDRAGVLGDITAILGKNNVSLRSVIQKGQRKDELVPLVLFTHNTKELNIQKALKEIESLEAVERIDNIIRIEDFES